MYKPMFVAPRHNELVCRITAALLPSLAQPFAGLREVHVPPEDLERMKALGPGRAVLAPNHPTGTDPVVMLWVSRKLGERFFYLAAREVLVGRKGWYLNQVGAYSVIRGIADRESIRATRKLLAVEDRKVVIFPEGEIYEHNDALLAFQAGVAQLGFWALDDLAKAHQPLALPLVPVAFKYRCCDNPRPAIDNSLKGLEQALDLPAPSRLTAYQRIRRIGDVMLGAVEREIGIEPDAEKPLPERIDTYRDRFLGRVARSIGVELDPEMSPAEQLHDLYYELRAWVGELPDDHNEYDHRRYRRRMEIAEPLFGELLRFQNFIAVSGDYIASQPTGERFLEVLGRLEKEVFAEVRTTVPREAHVRIGEPIRLEERFEAYRAARRPTVRAVTVELEAQIRSMLKELSTTGTPLDLES